MVRLALMVTAILSPSLAAQEPGVQRAHLGNRSWTDGTSWDTQKVPGALDNVFVPGFQGETTAAIRPAADAVAGALAVGHGKDTIGSVELVEAVLLLDESVIEGLPDAGRLFLGRDGGNGKFLQSGGLVSVSKSVQIADGSTSVGRYVMNGGILQPRFGIVVSNGARSVGTFEINGSNCSVQTDWYTHGSGQATLRMTADSRGFTEIVARQGVTLSGTLFADMSRFSTSADEVVLVDNRSGDQITGGFSKLQIIGAPNYQISYSGGDGNDLVLKRVTDQLNTFEAWAARYVPALPPGRTGLYQDDDSDGVGNLAEYKLGGLPTHAEDWEHVPTKKSGRWRLRYTENVERADAIIVPQVLVDGFWRSDRLRVDLIEEVDGTRWMEASFRGPQRPVRLHAELLPDPEKPTNIVFFIVDDLNDWVGCLGGHPQASTPNIDALAARGVLFTDAHCNAVNCNASRASILTGVLPSTSGIYHNTKNFRSSPVLHDVATLPEHFGTHGYDTVKVGKVFHRGEDVWTEVGPERGEIGGVENPNAPKTTRLGLDWAPVVRPDHDFFDHKAATWAVDYLSNPPADQPYFLVTGLYRPHLPWYAPQRFFDRVPLEEVMLPQTLATDLNDMPKPVFTQVVNFKDNDAIANASLNRSAVQGYLAATSFSDEQVGRVMQKLDALPSVRNTVIILISDHGFHLGEKTHWRKQTLWAESTRVPMIVVAPGVTVPGSRVTKPATLLDVYPTLCDLAGIDAPQHLEGVSMVPQLRDTGAARNRYVLTSRYYRQTSVRDKRYHYIRYRHGAVELYDHVADPNQWTNLAIDPAYTKTLRKFKNKLPKLNARSPK